MHLSVLQPRLISTSKGLTNDEYIAHLGASIATVTGKDERLRHVVHDLTTNLLGLLMMERHDDAPVLAGPRFQALPLEAVRELLRSNDLRPSTEDEVLIMARAWWLANHPGEPEVENPLLACIRFPFMTTSGLITFLTSTEAKLYWIEIAGALSWKHWFTKSGLQSELSLEKCGWTPREYTFLRVSTPTVSIGDLTAMAAETPPRGPVAYFNGCLYMLGIRESKHAPVKRQVVIRVCKPTLPVPRASLPGLQPSLISIHRGRARRRTIHWPRVIPHPPSTLPPPRDARTRVASRLGIPRPRPRSRVSRASCSTLTTTCPTSA